MKIINKSKLSEHLEVMLIAKYYCTYSSCSGCLFTLLFQHQDSLFFIAAVFKEPEEVVKIEGGIESQVMWSEGKMEENY